MEQPLGEGRVQKKNNDDQQIAIFESNSTSELSTEENSTCEDYYDDSYDSDDRFEEKYRCKPPSHINCGDDNAEYEEYNDDLTGCGEESEEWFEQQYCCFPLSQINRPDLEGGNRIIMPLSAFDQLARIKIEYPMVFEILNPYTEGASHCGVLEFTANEGFAFMPEWMLKKLQLEEGQLVTLKSATLPKGTFMKIQPHKTEFLRISDPKDVLEKTLRGFSCISSGDTIMVTHDHIQYYIDILETKPSSTISVVETDCEVEFAQPLDYEEPFTGGSRRLDGQPMIAPAEQDSVSTSMVRKDGPVAADSIRSRKHPGKPVFGPGFDYLRLEEREEYDLSNDQHNSLEGF